MADSHTANADSQKQESQGSLGLESWTAKRSKGQGHFLFFKWRIQSNLHVLGERCVGLARLERSFAMSDNDLSKDVQFVDCVEAGHSISRYGPLSVPLP